MPKNKTSVATQKPPTYDLSFLPLKVNTVLAFTAVTISLDFFMMYHLSVHSEAQFSSVVIRF